MHIMTNSYKAGLSTGTFTRRTLFSSAVALAIAGPAVLLARAQAADQPEATAQRHAWHEPHERHEKLMEDMIRDALRLTPEQQQAWEAIRVKQQVQRKAGRHAWSEVRQVLQAELAKPEPDLARVANVRDALMARNRQARKEIEDMRLKLYASFSPEQKAVVRDFLKLRLAHKGHGEHGRGDGREWHGEHSGKPGAPGEHS
jgi:Spy/CpxP family protein refolding chaperone